jgi:hypothetical protein
MVVSMIDAAEDIYQRAKCSKIYINMTTKEYIYRVKMKKVPSVFKLSHCLAGRRSSEAHSLISDSILPLSSKLVMKLLCVR